MGVEIIEAIYRSAQQDHAVTLPLSQDEAAAQPPAATHEWSPAEAE